MKEGNLEFETPYFVAPLGPAMRKDMPEVENYVRLRNPLTQYLSSGGQSLKVDGIVYADSTFFEISSFRLLAGSTAEALKAPNSIVLTPTLAVALFAGEDPIGKMVRINGGESFQVTGVVNEPPANSSIRYKALVSFSTLYHQRNTLLMCVNFRNWLNALKFRFDPSCRFIPGAGSSFEALSLAFLIGHSLSARLL